MNHCAVITIGRKEWPRFIVVREDHTYWTGQKWTPQAKQSLLFANYDEALQESIAQQKEEDSPNENDWQ